MSASGPQTNGQDLAETRLLAHLRTLTEFARALCRPASFDEGIALIGGFLPRLFAADSGALLLADGEHKPLRRVFEWGPTPPAPGETLPFSRSSLPQHDRPVIDGNAVFIPLLAAGHRLGAIHLSSRDGAMPKSLLDCELTDATVAQIALAVANLQWREELREQSIRDPLSQLYNRRYLEASTGREVARAERARTRRRRTGLAVLMLDVDDFKRFNDEHGHEAGDLVIAAIGGLLRRMTRASDIASRYGGEEFVVVLPDVTLERAMARAEEIRVAVGELKLEQQGEPLPQITASIGVAIFPRHGDSVESLIRAADLAMYAAKRAGRNQVCCAQSPAAAKG
ncbi:MAG: GGDEF domain-containing protein [Limnobacter sp.]|nr:GGDEF domain-containing protein [Limnobacter sp.]